LAALLTSAPIGPSESALSRIACWSARDVHEIAGQEQRRVLGAGEVGDEPPPHLHLDIDEGDLGPIAGERPDDVGADAGRAPGDEDDAA